MNKLTRKIRDKGYTLNEFCHAIGYSLRWYRTHASKDNKQNELIKSEIDSLQCKYTRDEYGNPPGYKSTFVADSIKQAIKALKDKS